MGNSDEGCSPLAGPGDGKTSVGRAVGKPLPLPLIRQFTEAARRLWIPEKSWPSSFIFWPEKVYQWKKAYATALVLVLNTLSTWSFIT